MNKKKIADLWLYRQRYFIAYGLLILSFLAILAFSIFVTPNGLTRGEISTATSAFNLSFENIFSKNIINAPFKILQKISIAALGLNNFSIKLPAALLSILAVFLIVKLSHAWFGRGVATISAILATASSQFFFVSQSGNAEILQITIPLAAIVLGFEFFRSKSKIALFSLIAVLALGTYTPAGILITLAILTAAIIHPIFRLEISRIDARDKWISAGIFVAIFTPILVSAIFDASVLGAIFGASENLNIGQNLVDTFSKIFTSAAAPTGEISPIITPPIFVLMVVGAFSIAQSWYSTRAFLLYSLTTLAFIACALSPSNSTLFSVPILILATTGLYGLIQSWYVLFPKNPFARIFGLIPISIFLVGFLTANIKFFSTTYFHSPEVGGNFNRDLSILLQNSSSENKLIVTEEEKPLFEILAHQNRIKLDGEADKIIISKAAYEQGVVKPTGFELSQIITSHTKSDSDRFYILKKQ